MYVAACAETGQEREGFHLIYLVRRSGRASQQSVKGWRGRYLEVHVAIMHSTYCVPSNPIQTLQMIFGYPAGGKTWQIPTSCCG